MPRHALFDLAVNRALSYTQSTGLNLQSAEASRVYKNLELWYLKTRFAYRVPLEQVITVLLTYPGGVFYWQGGSAGTWIGGEPPTP